MASAAIAPASDGIDIHVVQPDGSEKLIHASIGQSLLEMAQTHGIDGIVAECGGSMSCATCHVYIHADDLARLPPPERMEDEMLDGVASERRDGSRLACQIMLTAGLQGLRLTIPQDQY